MASASFASRSPMCEGSRASTLAAVPPSPSPTRRTVLRFGLVGATLLALGGVGLAVQRTALVSPRRPLRVLSEREFSVLVAWSDTLAPGGPGLPPASALGVAEQVDELLSWLHPGDAGDVRLALLLVENALPGVIFGEGRARPFTRCSPAERAAVLESMRTSWLPLRRTLWKALSGLVTGAYWSGRETWAWSGYPGPPAYGGHDGAGPTRPPVMPTPAERGAVLGASAFEHGPPPSAGGGPSAGTAVSQPGASPGRAP